MKGWIIEPTRTAMAASCVLHFRRVLSEHHPRILSHRAAASHGRLSPLPRTRRCLLLHRGDPGASGDPHRAARSIASFASPFPCAGNVGRSGSTRSSCFPSTCTRSGHFPARGQCCTHGAGGSSRRSSRSNGSPPAVASRWSSASRYARRPAQGVWQPRYWEHLIGDEDDFERHRRLHPLQSREARPGGMSSRLAVLFLPPLGPIAGSTSVDWGCGCRRGCAFRRFEDLRSDGHGMAELGSQSDPRGGLESRYPHALRHRSPQLRQTVALMWTGLPQRGRPAGRPRSRPRRRARPASR